MKRILLDTNFCIDIIRFKIDLEEIDKLVSGPYRLLALSSVLDELRKISKTKNKEGDCAKIALEFISSEDIEILATKEKSADRALISLADENTLVATNDIGLRKKLKNLGVKAIYLRSKQHLAVG